MVLCPPQVDSFSADSGASVTDIPFRTLLGLNQQSYDRLKTALGLNLRRQIFVAVCDDLLLRDRLAVQLQSELSDVGTSTPSTALSASPSAFMSAALIRPSASGYEPRVIPKLITLDLDLHDPDPIAQITDWLSYFPTASIRRSAIPTFQILGIERLTRQSAALQGLFLSYLQNIEQALPGVESSLLLWMTQPWFRMLPEAVPEFWRCRTGVFEFLGDPTPLPTSSPERIQISGLTTGFTSSPPSLPGSPPSSPPNAPSGSPGNNRPLPAEQTAAEADPANNPWIPLADDLAVWYESDSGTGEQPNRPQSQLITADSIPNFDQWIAAFSQVDRSQLDKAADNIAQTYGGQTKGGQTKGITVADLPADSASATAKLTDAELNGVELNGVELNDLAELDETELPLLEHIGLLQQQISMLQAGQESPVVLATAYRALGNFYRDCIEQGDASTENLAMAVQAYEQSLLWLPADQQAEVLNDLGNIYWMVAQTQSDLTEAVAGLQQTVQIYQMALHQLTSNATANSVSVPDSTSDSTPNPVSSSPLGSPPDSTGATLEQLDAQQIQTYAMVQNNLGAAYADLAQYQDPVEHLHNSIAAYHQALHYRPAAADPLRFASTQNNLGTAYWNLAQHQQPELNLKQAIIAYSEALSYYDPAQEPMHYAMIQNNLGTAYWNLAQYEQSQDYLLSALMAYEAALQYRTLESHPAGFAATQNNLGTAYWHLANQMANQILQNSAERLACLHQAISAYEITLEAADYLNLHQPQVALNFDLAATHNNLGLAHYQLAIEPQGPADEVVEHLEAALQHHLAASQAWEVQPDLRQTALNCLIQTVQAFYSQLGLAGQNQALTRLPSQLLSEILPQL